MANQQSTDLSNNAHHQLINERLIIFSNERIGSGAFGVVFKGSYEDRLCAVKVLHQVAMEIQTDLPAGQENETANTAFTRECEFLKSFQHPSVVQHLSTEKHPKSGGNILVTELMDCNLRSYLSNFGEKSLASYCQVSLSKDIASGLAYIHSKKIIHRDLCGDNILLTLRQPVPIAKISDFGMSRLIDPSQMSHTLTAVAHRMGYLPPEALRLEDEKYDHRLDVFSLGVIMVQIICKAETIKTVKDRRFHVSQIPDTHRLNQIISICLQEDMELRPAAGDICARLEGELKGREEMPFGMSTCVQSVVFGDAVYVGGGGTNKDEDSCTVMKLDLQQGEWTKLLRYIAKWFAMMVLNNQLLLVGGFNPNTQKSENRIATFWGGSWIYHYPHLNIARHSSTAVYFNNCIIVAGGYNNQGFVSSVEVLDVASSRWYFAQSLPRPRSVLKSTLIGDTLYLIGGWENPTCATKAVYKIDLDKLILNTVQNQAMPTLWEVIEDTPLLYSAPLNIRGSLYAVGGYDDGGPSSSIHLYQPDTRRWAKVGDLPTARWYCTCSVLPSGEVLVAGGQTNFLHNQPFCYPTANFLIIH